MGCDIHIWIETRRKGEKEWSLDPHHVLTEDSPGDSYKYLREVTAVHRDYELFGILAGVRRSGNQMYDTRGVPNNASKILKKYLKDDTDLHTPSWLTVEEFGDCLAKAYELDERGWRPKNPNNANAFYDWRIHDSYDDRNEEPGFHSIVNYCKNLQVDNILLDEPPLDVRLVFCFDN